MAPTPETRRHDWRFLATSSAAARTVVPVTIAVCAECGRIRSAVAIIQHETSIDLRGECPGRASPTAGP